MAASEEIGIRIGVIEDLIAQLQQAVREMRAYHQWMHESPKRWQPTEISWNELQRIVKRRVREEIVKGE